MTAITNIGKTLRNTSFATHLNKAGVTNFMSSPNAAVMSVATLVTTNQACRVYAALTDKNEKPKARYYTALTDALHEGFCLFTLFAVRPAFMLGGLLLGKHMMAKNAFKSVDTKAILNLKVPELINKAKKEKTVSALTKHINNISDFFYKKTGLQDMNKVIKKIQEHNGNTSRNVREALFGKKPKDIVIKTQEGAMLVTKKGRESRSFISNLLDKTKDKEFVKQAAEDKFIKSYDIKEAQRLHDKGEVLLTNGNELMGGKREAHDMIVGSRGLGEALGMAAAISIISPMFTNKYVPLALKALGLDENKKEMIDVKTSGSVSQLRENFKNEINK